MPRDNLNSGLILKEDRRRTREKHEYMLKLKCKFRKEMIEKKSKETLHAKLDETIQNDNEEKLKMIREKKLQKEREQTLEKERHLCKTYKTNLLEFLNGCHIFLHQKFIIQNKNYILIEKVNPSDIEQRPRPERIRKWSDFPQRQKIIWDELMKSDFRMGRHFNSLDDLRKSGNHISSMKIRFKGETWSFFDRISIKHVRAIVEQIYQDSRLRESFKLKETIYNQMIFTSPISNLYPSKCFDGKTFPYHSTIKISFNRPHYDQFSAYIKDLNRNLSIQDFPAFITEFKPPQQLKLEYIKQGLREMDLDDVVNYGNNESTQKLCCRLIAAIITRVFSYMIQAGLEFGCIWTGEAIIFLRVPDDPRTVLYHLSVPEDDVGVTTGWSDETETENRLHLTAIAQMLAFTLQSTRARPRSHSWRLKAMYQLKKWRVAYENLLGPISDSVPDLNFSLPVSRSMDEKSIFDNSPMQQQSGLDETSNVKPGDYFTNSCQTESNERQDHSPTNSVAQYCTHKCLHGLKHGGPLDQKCPNSKEHGTEHHQISKSTFLELIRRQLAEDLDTNFETICYPGDCGAPFKVRLKSHGYTLFAKCVPEHEMSYLEYEAEIYDQLEWIQGSYVPVHLGHIDLEQPYFLLGQILLVRAMFLSYGGKSLEQMSQETDKENYRNLAEQFEKTFHLSQRVKKAYRKIHDLDVIHRHVTSCNLLLDLVTGQIMVVNFKYASPIDFCKAYRDMRRRKKRRLSDELDCRTGPGEEVEVELSEIKDMIKCILHRYGYFEIDSKKQSKQLRHTCT